MGHGNNIYSDRVRCVSSNSTFLPTDDGCQHNCTDYVSRKIGTKKLLKNFVLKKSTKIVFKNCGASKWGQVVVFLLIFFLRNMNFMTPGRRGPWLPGLTLCAKIVLY